MLLLLCYYKVKICYGAVTCGVKKTKVQQRAEHSSSSSKIVLLIPIYYRTAVLHKIYIATASSRSAAAAGALPT